MKALVQRVTEASVTIDGEVVAEIGRGYLVLFGVTHGDTEAMADKLASRVVKLRIFEDENGKTNKSIEDVAGSVIVVSQFTLYADTDHGNRPGFSYAGKPEQANALYEYILEKTRETVPVVEKGIFGADMKVALVNDGPFTIVLEDRDL